MNYKSYFLTLACLISLTPCTQAQKTVSEIFLKEIKEITEKCKQSYRDTNGETACEIYAFNVAVAIAHLEAQMQLDVLQLENAPSTVIDGAKKVEECLAQAARVSPFKLEEKINTFNKCQEFWKALVELIDQ